MADKYNALFESAPVLSNGALIIIFVVVGIIVLTFFLAVTCHFMNCWQPAVQRMDISKLLEGNRDLEYQVMSVMMEAEYNQSSGGYVPVEGQEEGQEEAFLRTQSEELPKKGLKSRAVRFRKSLAAKCAGEDITPEGEEDDGEEGNEGEEGDEEEDGNYEDQYEEDGEDQYGEDEEDEEQDEEDEDKVDTIQEEDEEATEQSDNQREVHKNDDDEIVEEPSSRPQVRRSRTPSRTPSISPITSTSSNRALSPLVRPTSSASAGLSPINDVVIIHESSRHFQAASPNESGGSSGHIRVTTPAGSARKPGVESSPSRYSRGSSPILVERGRHSQTPVIMESRALSPIRIFSTSSRSRNMSTSPPLPSDLSRSGSEIFQRDTALPSPSPSLLASPFQPLAPRSLMSPPRLSSTPPPPSIVKVPARRAPRLSIRPVRHELDIKPLIREVLSEVEIEDFGNVTLTKSSGRKVAADLSWSDDLTDDDDRYKSRKNKPRKVQTCAPVTTIVNKRNIEWSDSITTDHEDDYEPIVENGISKSQKHESVTSVDDFHSTHSDISVDEINLNCVMDNEFADQTCDTIKRRPKENSMDTNYVDTGLSDNDLSNKSDANSVRNGRTENVILNGRIISPT